MADTGAPLPRRPPLQALLQEMWASVPETARRLLALAADVAVYSFIAAMWLNNAANAAAIFSRWACGEDSPAVAAAMKVFKASLLAMGAFVPFASPLLIWRSFGPPTERRESGGGAAKAQAASVQRRRRDGTGACRREEGSYGPVALFSVVFAWWVVIVGVLLRDLAPEKGSCQHKVGSVLTDIGGFANSAMLCFVSAPNMVIFLMRDSRR
ncbi:hypothetical protein E2562_013355 [Oryza meyeriana var. granulata]|uniref:Uncharacterized protein n=1 Tax=Oryza meyeriana var. granulata TaxID=110450 RepID=A0A6G1CG64_9ORYZ|nr:hypothetical protein E2562_013355 [Oryza meyeriana var. granulata]